MSDRHSLQSIQGDPNRWLTNSSAVQVGQFEGSHRYLALGIGTKSHDASPADVTQLARDTELDAFHVGLLRPRL